VGYAAEWTWADALAVAGLEIAGMADAEGGP